jgi:hypothetical protein
VNTSAVARLTPASIPYKTTTGLTIAADWASLTSGTLATPIEFDETGSPAAGEAWTNTAPNGNLAGLFDCGQWNNTALGGQPGLLASTTTTWTQTAVVACSSSLHLYCVEQ